MLKTKYEKLMNQTRSQTNHEIFYSILNGRSENNKMIKPIKISIF